MQNFNPPPFGGYNETEVVSEPLAIGQALNVEIIVQAGTAIAVTWSFQGSPILPILPNNLMSRNCAEPLQVPVPPMSPPSLNVELIYTTPGTYNISACAYLVGAPTPTWSKLWTVTVVAPSFTNPPIVELSRSNNVLYSPSHNIARFLSGTSINPGMRITVNGLNRPNLNGQIINGMLCAVQTFNGRMEYNGGCLNTGGLNYLDWEQNNGPIPYYTEPQNFNSDGFNFTDSDTPSVEVITASPPNAPIYNIDMIWEYYIMYMPIVPGNGAMWVPILKLEWSWYVGFSIESLANNQYHLNVLNAAGEPSTIQSPLNNLYYGQRCFGLPLNQRFPTWSNVPQDYAQFDV